MGLVGRPEDLWGSHCTYDWPFGYARRLWKAFPTSRR